MSAGGGSEEKSEKPTPQKIKQSRKEGTVARTPELGAWASVLAVAVCLHWLVGMGMDSIQSLMGKTLIATEQATAERALSLLGEAGVVTLLLTAGFGAFICVIAVVGAIAQGGMIFATKAVKPKWSRLNPLEGAKRLFGPHALWEGAKMLVKSALVGIFVYRAIQDLMPMLGGMVPLSVALGVAADAATGLMRDVAVAGLVAACGDYAMARRRTGKQTRMTKKEVRDEHKNSEGDPLLKGALRSRQLAAARNRMMADIPEADVVLVNPTHVAVALRYDPAKGTPRVVAKGAGVIATKIRELADESRVSMVEDVPLARALYASCEVGQEIPPELYQAVAQVLAFVLSRKAAGVPAGRFATPRDAAPLPYVPRHRRRVPALAAADA